MEAVWRIGGTRDASFLTPRLKTFRSFHKVTILAVTMPNEHLEKDFPYSSARSCTDKQDELFNDHKLQRCIAPQPT
jgi:hypothetical protein